MPAQCELRGGPQHGKRIDTGMPCKPSILSGDQHAAVERVDLLKLDRQPPFAVGRQKPPQDRPVRGVDED